MKNGVNGQLSKLECKKYMEALEKKNWSTFNEMITEINRIHVVQVDPNNWKLSTCTCSSWLKDYKVGLFNI